MENEKPVPGAERVFFSTPVYHGKNYVKKLYRPFVTGDQAQEAFTHHEIYVRALKKAGIKIPPTIFFYFNHYEKGFSIEIVQERFEPEQLAKKIIKDGSDAQATETTRLILEDIVKFHKSSETKNMGFVPSLSNYAIVDGVAYYFDTFPILTSNAYAKEQIIRHAPTRALRGIIKGGLKNLIGLYTEEYFDPVLMTSETVRSACRERPELAEKLEDLATGIISKEQFPWADELGEKIIKGYKKLLRHSVAQKLNGLRPSNLGPKPA